MLAFVDLAHLQLFREIARTGSVSRGAREMQVTQSAASQAVQELERGLGVQLLDRSRRPLELTPAGERFLEFCRDVLRRRNELETQLSALRDAGAAVRVATIYSVRLSEMSELEAAFAARAPGARLEVDYLRPERVYEAVAEGRADLGIVSYPEGGRGLEVLPWRSEPMLVTMAPSHPLARRRSIRPAELDGAGFIGFDNELPISRDIERYFREQRVHVRTLMHFDNIQSMKEALRLGNAVAILPEPMLRAEVQEGRLRAVPLAVALERPLGIIHLRRHALPPAAQAFLELLLQPAAA